MRDNVRRIGDIDDNAVKTGFFDGFCYILQNGDGLTQCIHTGLIAGRQRACRNDHNLCVLGIAVVTRGDLGANRKVIGRIGQVERLCDCLCVIGVNVDDLVCQTLRNQCVADMGADMACTDNNNFAIGNTHVRHSLMRVLLDDLAADELHNTNNDDEDQHSDVGNVQHVAVVAVTDGEVAQTAGTDDTGHCGQVE